MCEPDKWSDTFKAFLSRALNVDVVADEESDVYPEKRATAKELLDDPFICCACSAEEFMEFANEIIAKRKNE